MNTPSEQVIHYPAAILWAIDQEPDEFEAEARLLLALSLYESSRLSTELAAQLAGMSRFAFIFELGKHGLSPFRATAAELAEDLEYARRASYRQ
jgi:predicted HTH domain antitoxin